MISKKLFAKVLTDLRDAMDEDVRKAYALEKAFPNAFAGNLMYNNTKRDTAIIDMLSNELKYKDNLVWFVYDADFGRDKTMNYFFMNGIKYTMDSIESFTNFIYKYGVNDD